MAFASFGFCKAHAAAFALPTYQSAWLKTHHPAAFLAGVLTHDPGMYPKRLILDDARHFGVAVLPIDVERLLRCLPGGARARDGYGIRLPLAEVKGISEAEVARIVAGQPYAGLADFVTRAGVVPAGRREPGPRGGVRRAVRDRPRCAARSAATTSPGATCCCRWPSWTGTTVRCRPDGRSGRRVRTDTAALDADPAVSAARQSQASAAPSCDRAAQLLLDLGDEPGGQLCSGLPEMDSGDRVRAELEVLGLDVSMHVMDFYRPMLAELGAVRGGGAGRLPVQGSRCWWPG